VALQVHGHATAGELLRRVPRTSKARPRSSVCGSGGESCSRTTSSGSARPTGQRNAATRWPVSLGDEELRVPHSVLKAWLKRGAELAARGEVSGMEMLAFDRGGRGGGPVPDAARSRTI